MNSITPLALALFFFNSFLLPHGLVWSSLLAPVFVYYLYKNNIYRFYLPLIGSTALLSFLHWSMGANPHYLVQSGLLFISSGIFFAACRLWLKTTTELKSVMHYWLVGTTLFTGLAIMMLPFEWGRMMLWYEVPISHHIEPFPRLKLFTYEAAYLALTLAPVVLYYYWQLASGIQRHILLLSVALVAPLALSLSFGVIAALLLSLAITVIVFYRKVLGSASHRRAVAYGLVLPLIISGLTLFAFPGNPVTKRLQNIVTGEDTSAKGRMMDAFIISWDIAETKSAWIGAGLGQTKEVGRSIIIDYYNYRDIAGAVARIPNCVAEWLATFGILGVSIKFVLLFYLLFQFRIYSNPFNLSLFIFMFIYQFTGSYLINPVEILIWAMAAFSSENSAFHSANQRHPA